MNQNRPILVWLIALFCVLAGASQLLSHTAVISGTIPLNEKTHAVVASWTLLDMVTPYILSGVLIAAAIALITMRKLAFELYVIYLGLVSAATIQQAITTDWVHQFGMAAWSAVFGFALFSIMTWYVYRLRVTGVLR